MQIFNKDGKKTVKKRWGKKEGLVNHYIQFFWLVKSVV